MYTDIASLIAAAGDAPLWRAALENEARLTGRAEEDIFAALAERFAVMEASCSRALAAGLPTVGGLITGVASAQAGYAAAGGLLGQAANTAMARALSASETNAAMGRICACPTAGACGVVPAVLMYMRDKYDLTDRRVLEGLLTATAIGAVIQRNATVAGAEAGCQAECGAAAAMAAAAAAELAGGDAQAAANAVALALMNCMGLVCDPVAGLVQVPCAARNASQAMNALLSADLAMGGMAAPIPADEVIDAMYRVGKLLPPALRETALGGIAAAPAAKAIARRVFGGGEA